MINHIIKRKMDMRKKANKTKNKKTTPKRPFLRMWKSYLNAEGKYNIMLDLPVQTEGREESGFYFPSR